MSRPLRIEYEGAWYHIMNRGADRQDVFLTQQHHEMFLEVLLQIHRRFQIEVHSYCLLPNHYHLLVKTPLANLSKAMKYLNSVYTQRFNASCNRDGALFRGRFKSIIIDSENYLLQLSRYIHLNPVKSGLVDKAEKYSWSSYQYFINPKLKPDFLLCDETLDRFTDRFRRKQYKLFVEEGIDKEIDTFYQKIQHIPILGTEAFTKRISEKYLSDKKIDSEITEHKNLIKKQLPSTADVFQGVAKYYNVTVDDIKTNKHKQTYIPRYVAIYLCVMVAQASLMEVTEFLSTLSYSAVAKTFKRFTLLLETETPIVRDIENLKNMIL